MRFRPRMVAAVGMAAVLISGVLISSPSHAATGPVTPASTAALGVAFLPNGDAGQCSGPRLQWVDAGSWSTAIRIDADSRSGWCELGFGVQAASVGFTYTWISAGGAAAQCGNPGLYVAPEADPGVTGSRIRIDTDSRLGGCYLTLGVDSASWLVDVFYFADGDTGQCGGQSVLATVARNTPVRLLVDTDRRTGGCQLQLRLRSV